MAGTVLILGASGLFGAAAARAFQAAGWQVRRFTRGGDMAAAASGADVIVNALNPPNYHDWDRQIPAITAEVLGAARASGATVIVPGNVYVYGNQPSPWGATTPHRPVSRKGRIRAAMEAQYAAAAAAGARVILLRGGDFIAPDNPRAVLNMVVLKRLARGRITSIGDCDAPRAYAYLPDMARAAVALADRRATLPAFADIAHPGLTFSIAEFRAEIETLLARPIALDKFNWLTLRLLSPVWELAREFLEMRYLYDLPHSLAPEPFRALLPDFVSTSFAEVVAAQISAVQGTSISTQTSRWRDAASVRSRSGSSGRGQTTPLAVTRNPVDGST